TATRDFIDVRDAAAAVTRLAEAGESGAIYNVASGYETPVSEVFDRLVVLSGITGLDIERQPARVGDTERSFADVTALTGLGFEARYDLDAALRETFRYYTDELAERLSELATSAATLSRSPGFTIGSAATAV